MKKLITLILLVFTVFSVGAKEASIVVMGEYRFSQYYTIKELYELDKFFGSESSILIEDNEPVYVWKQGTISMLFIPDNNTPGFGMKTYYESDKDCKVIQGILYKIVTTCANKIDVENLKITNTNCIEDERAY